MPFLILFLKKAKLKKTVKRQIMKHSKDFFRDEIRNGFYVPTAVKQAWAVTLDVLSEIDRICEKYGITYYADWGTFLGAVRHGGFIPWDDDLDICMKRQDYIKFREVADKELPSHYDIHDYERHEDHWLFLSRVVNNKKICFDPDYLNSHYNLPWLAGVDIFVKDYLYTDPEEESKRDKEIMDILACADGFTNGRFSKDALLKRAEDISKKYCFAINKSGSDREIAVSLYKLAEREMGRVGEKDSNTIGQIFPWILKSGSKAGEPSLHYEKIIRLPFEDTTIPVPAFYNKVLTRRYGQYLKIRKVWGGHDYPFYEAQKKEMMRLSGGDFPGFKFRPEMLERPESDKSGSLKNISAECLTGLEGFYNEALSLTGSGNLDGLEEVFQNSQQLAEDFGTLIENVLGENKGTVKAVVRTLEKYCEEIFNAFGNVSESGKCDMSGIRDALDEICDAVKINILNRKEICFITTGPEEWKNLESEYKKACALEDTDVYVIPLPLLTKDIYGNIMDTDEEIAAACDPGLYNGAALEEHLTDFASYDPSLHCPDKIYIQNGYDGENPLLTVPSVFYSENLRKYTDELCFVFIGKTCEFGEEDTTDIYNLRNYITVPGIIYSDKIFVQSENIKERYIDALCEFAGDDTRKVWQEKLVVRDDSGADPSEASTDMAGKKRILFCIGISELAEKPKYLADGIKDKLAVLTDPSSGTSVSVLIYPEDKEQWGRLDRDLSEELFSILDTAEKADKIERIYSNPRNTDNTAREYDAYYGSPSPYVPAFSTQGKPVMIADFSLTTEK